MPAKQKPSDSESLPLNTVTRDEAEITLATALPKPLVALVYSYVVIPPEIIDKVKNNLGKLPKYSYLDWDGISVASGLKTLVQESLSFSHLKLNGIIFGEPEENKSVEARETFDRTIYSQLRDLYDRRKVMSYHKICFDSSSLMGSKFEDLSCSFFTFGGSNLTDASFKHSTLTGTSFERAQMGNVDLSFCYGVRYNKSNHQNFSVVLYSESASTLPGMKPISANFDETKLEHANLFKSNFSGTEFNKTILDTACLIKGRFDDATFSGCSMQKTNLSTASFFRAKFPKNKGISTNLSCAIAIKTDFTNADFTNTNLQNMVLTEAKLIGATFTGADMTGAQLNGAHFQLNQFTKEQVLSFYYKDPHATQYINAIYDYMEKNEEAKHTKGFQRARLLILSFIDNEPYEKGQNTLLAGFLKKGKLADEGSYGFFSSSSEKNEKSLLSVLLAAQEKIRQQQIVATPSAMSTPRQRKSSDSA